MTEYGLDIVYCSKINVQGKLTEKRIGLEISFEIVESCLI